LAAVHPHEVTTLLISSGAWPALRIVKVCLTGGPLSAVPKL
jgi:hypothetical protein